MSSRFMPFNHFLLQLWLMFVTVHFIGQYTHDGSFSVWASSQWKPSIREICPTPFFTSYLFRSWANIITFTICKNPLYVSLVFNKNIHIVPLCSLYIHLFVNVCNIWNDQGSLDLINDPITVNNDLYRYIIN